MQIETQLSDKSGNGTPTHIINIYNSFFVLFFAIVPDEQKLFLQNVNFFFCTDLLP